MRRRAQIVLAGSAIAFIAGVAGAQFTPPPREFNGWVNAGDARAVPIIVGRLREAAGRPADATSRFFLGDMLRDAARFQLVEFGPTLAAFAQRADLSEVDLETAAEAAAAYDDLEAMSLQRALLANPRFVQPEGRVRLLSKLAEHEDERAADSLADWTLAEFRRIEPLGPEHGEASNALWQDVPRTRSTRLLARLRAMPPLATEFGRKLQAELVARCEAAQRSREVHYAFLATATADQKLQTMDALVVLGKIGTPDDRERLARCPVGLDDALGPAEYVSDDRGFAIGELSRRYWRLPASQPSTRPIDGP